ncbi:hypothetical protein CHARACLAT_004778 [Characodon lateralis]|uniref:Alkylated DNA repair protein AlkB homologue 8 N-terminal domain-containing protein n=1 Tax=Characodon lateralis TaxID=208331 RepID=A0ABU7D481_9TELE|nr:hypothetical protein [Characodon lateralis]
MGEELEVMEEYKYLDVHLYNRLDWRCNSEAVFKKGQSRLYFLRKSGLSLFAARCCISSISQCANGWMTDHSVNRFGVPGDLINCYTSAGHLPFVVESVICSVITCWGRRIRAREL